MKNRKTVSNDLPRVLSPARKPLFARVLVNAAIQVLMAVAMAWFTRGALQAVRLQESAHVELAAVMVAALGIYALKIIEAGDAEQLGQRYVTSVRLRILKRLVRFSGKQGNPQGRYGLTMTRLTSDLNSLRNWVAFGVARGSVALTSLIGLTVIVATLSKAIAAVFLLWIAMVLGISFFLTRALRQHVQISRRQRGRLANVVGDLVLSARESRLLGRSARDMQRVQKQSTRVRHAMSKRTLYSQALRMLPTTSLPMSWVGILFFVPDVSTESFVTSLLMFSLAANSLAQLARAIDYRINFIEGRLRIREVLAVKRIRESTQAIELAAHKSIGFDVKLIPSETGTELGFHVEAGSKVCLGQFAAQAVRIFTALTRVEARKDTAVELNGSRIENYTLHSLHSGVQWVNPEFRFREGDVWNNLAYVTDDVEAIEIALLLCGLHASDELPDGPATQNIYSLPQSIQARIRLARAVVLRPGLLLISEKILWQQPTLLRYLIGTIEWLGCTVVLAENTSVELDGFHFTAVVAENLTQESADNATIYA